MNRSENRLLPVPAPGPQDRQGGRGSSPSGAGRAARAGTDARVEPSFAAQIMGQGGQKRGLKGGQPVLKAANAAYLGTEYSGDQDRRPSPGLLKRTTI
jgi:hypothetical protein